MADHSHNSERDDGVLMPRPTAAPLIVSLGVALLAAGPALNWFFSVVGLVLLVVGLTDWIRELLPGGGHVVEPRVAVELRPAPVRAVPGEVQHLAAGMPGYRLRLPIEVHPISAGIKGGVVGGLVMPIPALLYGLLSGKGLWYPVNLLAGMTTPGVDAMTTEELGQFHLGLVVVAIGIHAVTSVVLGLIYGVLLPTLPRIPRPMAWGGLLMPILWTAGSYALMGTINPLLARGIDWPWFIVSQGIFGLVTALVVMRAGEHRSVRAGLIGGLVGGALMTLPALIWSLAAGHGVWYPLNLLAGMTLRGLDQLPLDDFKRFHPEWIAAALATHLAFCTLFGLVYGLALRRLPPIAAPLAWGGLVMPILWTAMSFSMMGVVNPALQQRVDWPGFIVSQFIFGVVAAIVVVRSERRVVPPAGGAPGIPFDTPSGADW